MPDGDLTSCLGRKTSKGRKLEARVETTACIGQRKDTLLQSRLHWAISVPVSGSLSSHRLELCRKLDEDSHWDIYWDTSLGDTGFEDIQ